MISSYSTTLKNIRNRHFFLADLILMPVAAYLSFVLRLDTLDLGLSWSSFWAFAITSLLVTPIIFRNLGIYARYWFYASIEEIILLGGGIFASSVASSMISLLILWFLPGIFQFPRSVPFIFMLLGLGAAALPRLAARLIYRYQQRQTRRRIAMPVLVVGAGDTGASLVRDLQSNWHADREIVAFIDDDESKHGVRIHGITVRGGRYDIPRLVHDYQVEQVIIAMPTAPGKAIREIVQICEQSGVPTKTIPGVHELVDGAVSVSQLRDVQIEDLLRRETVQTDMAGVRDLLTGQRVLVTGGGGSIGRELCRQILARRPSELILLGHGENSIFESFHSLRRLDGSAGVTLKPIIADIRFPERIRAVLERTQPHIVFHAAAHKHVPLMELNPAEAVTNNVLGTRNLLNACLAVGVEHFVMISTDKAVNPTSVMGVSKRVAELFVHRAAQESGRPYVAVRFGNVLGSRGSVVLTFKDQIARGGPVTITHPDITRFFMTIPEAVQLVLQAAAMGTGSEVFVLDMGEPVRIMDLARDLIELSGLEVERDIDIEVIGLRPGEKLYEELFIEGEEYRRTRHQKIFIAAQASKGTTLDLDQAVGALQEAAAAEDILGILNTFQTIVPEARLTQLTELSQP